ncbi:MAG: sulfatase family protein [Armatimonadota bacterium]
MPPNLLFIMADQYRHDYLGCAGAGWMHTPNLDALAARGVRVTGCCSNAPVCVPARIGLATGLQPSRLGALDNDAFLPRSATTYYQRLRDHGYRVGCVGKLDLAKPDRYNGRHGDRPCVYSWGFTHPEEVEGKMHSGRFPTPLGPYTFHLQERGLLQRFYEDYQARAAKGWIKDASHDSVLPAEEFADAYIGRRAAEWTERVPDDFPWHLFVSFAGPHDPFDPPTVYADRYRHAAVPPAIQDDLSGKPQRHQYDMTPEEVAVTRRQYSASCALIDDEIGRILKAVEARGMLGDTVVVFSSDHGEMLGDHGFYTKSKPYEASLRLPLIAVGPGIRKGVVSDALVELIDLNPTLCDFAGLPPQPDIDARSLAPLLRGETDAHRPDCAAALRTFRCLRTDRYKLVRNINDVTELYDLTEDPNELHNIANEHPELVRDLDKRLCARFMEGKCLR